MASVGFAAWTEHRCSLAKKRPGEERLEIEVTLAERSYLFRTARATNTTVEALIRAILARHLEVEIVSTATAQADEDRSEAPLSESQWRAMMRENRAAGL